jgi:hypothetical protein
MGCTARPPQVLRWLHEEEAVDAAYLTAAVVEYIASVEAAGLPIPPDLFCLVVDCMLEQGQVSQVGEAAHAARQLFTSIVGDTALGKC